MKEAMNVTLAEAGCLLHETAICLQWVTSLYSIITSNDGANSEISKMKTATGNCSYKKDFILHTDCR